MSVGNLAAVLEARAAARCWGDKIAFLVGDAAFTHREVQDGAARMASLLAGVGVRRGDRVLIVLDDGVEFAWAFLGAVRLGAVAVPVNPMLTREDHSYMLADSGARVVVCSAELASRFEDQAWVVGAEELAQRLRVLPPHPPADVSPDAAAYAQYTSGTTGAPKAALHRHGDPVVYHEAFALGALGSRADDVTLSVSKLYFAYGLGNSLFFPLLTGARAVLHAGRPCPEDVAALVERHAVSLLYAVPTFYANLLRTAPAECFASLRAAVSAGECLMMALAGRTRDFLGCPVLDGLGSTEVGQTFASNTLREARDGTVGRTLPPYEVCVRNGEGHVLSAGEVGTLWVRGPTVLIEYLGKPEATAAVKRDGWLCTGDRASLDREGFVHHQGRIDDIEVVAGICLSPAEIEQVLCGHPAVSEVAVAGVRDREGASRLEAFVVPTPGAGPIDTLTAELVALARARLAPYKVPRAVTFVDVLPRTATGKLRRFVLRTGWRGTAPPQPQWFAPAASAEGCEIGPSDRGVR